MMFNSYAWDLRLCDYEEVNNYTIRLMDLFNLKKIKYLPYARHCYLRSWKHEKKEQVKPKMNILIIVYVVIESNWLYLS